ncbi:MAG: heavy-metal-associated domain-containing protein [Armatimonadota bacterium]|nr:MAG: heavy-metal-associated domain-containing protein [Armatimonadota bacterium]
MSTRIFDVPTIKGEACVRTISTALRRLPGIMGVQVDIEAKEVCVDLDSALVNEVQVIQTIRELGHEAK